MKHTVNYIFHFLCILFIYFMGLGIELRAQNTSNPTGLLHLFDDIQQVAEEKAHRTLQEISFDPTQHPDRTDPETGRWITRNHNEWTSGFFSGILWQLYKLTGNTEWREQASLWTAELEPQKNNRNDHDTGFRIMSSFGLGYKLTGNPDWSDIIREAAGSLASRYDPAVGAIKSWNPWESLNANYPVIIDNMMNLELLFWASERVGGDEWYNIAVQHAKTTLEHHFRPDGTTYHIVDFDDEGNVNRKFTTQGYGPNSVWARGQAWAIYGFVMTYRFTKDEAFLEAAQSAADYYIVNLPADNVPYYDFMAPASPWRTKDNSSSAIAASALIELYEFTEHQPYLEKAESTLLALSTDPYFSSGDEISSLLTKGTRHHGDPEIGLIYADYYFLEAWIRYLTLKNHSFPELEKMYFLYLGQNYPNPFSYTTTIPFEIELDGRVVIQLFDITGRLVKTLVDKHKTTGKYFLQFETRNLASGIYIYKMSTENQANIQKMTLIR